MDKKNASKPQPLQKMFSGVPFRYDLLNRIFTGGLDQRWRRLAAEQCLSTHPRRVLDLCTGTGDLALHLTRLAPKEVVINAVDFCRPMLNQAREKAAKQKLIGRIHFFLANGAELPFSDSTFQAVGIAFGFRNLTYRNPNRERFFSELLRILAPRGKLVIVETSQPRLRLLRALFHGYLGIFVKPAGGILSGKFPAYRYLAHSTMHYYDAAAVDRLLYETGFHSVGHSLLLGGIAALHTASR